MTRPHDAPTAPSSACRHDTHSLPPGEFFFAPGAVEGGPPRRSRARRILAALAETLIWLAIAAAVGMASGWVQTKGLL